MGWPLFLALALLAGSAQAQTGPGWAKGYVPPAAEWHTLFQSKQDYPIPSNAVALGQMATMPAGTVVCNPSGSSATPTTCDFVSPSFVSPSVQSITSSGGQLISLSPVGNPTAGPLLTTYASHNMAVTTSKANNREFAMSLGLTSNLGTGNSPTVGNADKVVLYTGIMCNTGSIMCWSTNSLITLGASPSADLHSVVGTEIDYLNNYANLGGYAGGYNQLSTGAGCPGSATGGGTWSCVSTGLIIISGGSFHSDAGIVIGSTLAGNAFYRGVAVVSATTNAYEDGSVAATSMFVQGNKTYVIDAINATISTAFLRSPGFTVSGTGRIIINLSEATGLSQMNLINTSTNANARAALIMLSGSNVGGLILYQKPTGEAIINNADNSTLSFFTNNSLVATMSATQNTSFFGRVGLAPATWANNQTCTTGQISVDTGFIYVCTTTNTVKRVAIAAF